MKNNVTARSHCLALLKPEGKEKKQEHSRLMKESCSFSDSDVGCGHACTDLVLADHAEKEWANVSSLHGQVRVRASFSRYKEKRRSRSIEGSSKI